MKLLLILGVSCCTLQTAAATSVPDTTAIVLSGKVACDNTTRPLQAKLYIQRDEQPAIEVQADAHGHFTATVSPADVYVITARKDGYEDLEEVIALEDAPSDSPIFLTMAMIPLEKMKVHGTVFDSKTKSPITAELDVYFDSDVVKEDVQIAEDGRYEERFTKFGWYIVEVFAPGYLHTHDTVWVIDYSRTVQEKDYYLTPLETGLTVRLKNIQFTFGKTELHPDSYSELNSLAELLIKNPTIKIEIAGHTDNEGEEDYNLFLSQGRAQSVVDFLISQGVSAAQMIAKGYGESKPLDNRETKAAKSLNRRVEFVVIGSN